MDKEGRSRFRSRLIYGLALAAVGLFGFSVGAQKPIPIDLLRNYPLSLMASEVETMNECAECHAADDYHTCQTCHDDHGAIELDEIPFYALVEITGDVPDPGYVSIHDILPYQEQPNTHIPLLTFLKEQGVTDFESVTLSSYDGGFITLEKSQLTDQALLMPYEDGIRFAAEDLHVSTWLKGINRFIVVGKAVPLIINGEATSIGRLLLGPTTKVTIEQTEVMLKSEQDGKVRKAMTAGRIEGVALEDILPDDDFAALKIVDDEGQLHRLSVEEAQGALLAIVSDQVTLILPERGRSQWIPAVVIISTEEW
jgi:hypothetical protein